MRSEKRRLHQWRGCPSLQIRTRINVVISTTLVTRFRTIRGGGNVLRTFTVIRSNTFAEIATGGLVFGAEVNITTSVVLTKATTTLTHLIREEIVSIGILWAPDTMSVRSPTVKAEGRIP
jgi:hypothetical protein